MELLFQTIAQMDDLYIRMFQAILRYLLPFLAAIVLFRAIRPLLTFRREPEIWGWLEQPDGKRTSITHWENIIGRSRHSDIVIDAATVSRSHAVLTRYDDGTWTIADAMSKSGTQVNGEAVDSKIESGILTVEVAAGETHIAVVTEAEEEPTDPTNPTEPEATEPAPTEPEAQQTQGGASLPLWLTLAIVLVVLEGAAIAFNIIRKKRNA